MFTAIAVVAARFIMRRPGLSLIIGGVLVGTVALAYGGGKARDWWHKHQQDKVLQMDNDSIHKTEEARNQALKAAQEARQALQQNQAILRQLGELGKEVKALRARADALEPQVVQLRKSRQQIEAQRAAQPPPRNLQEAHSALEALGYVQGR